MRTLLTALVLLFVAAGCGAPGPSGPASEKAASHAPVGTAVTAATFESEVTKYKGVVVADYWATWCGPCKIIAGTLKELSSELPGTVKFVNIDVDQEKDLALKAEVESLPTLVLYKDGVAAGRIIGAQKKEAIKEFIANHLK